jgi:hypothetical protein
VNYYTHFLKANTGQGSGRENIGWMDGRGERERGREKERERKRASTGARASGERMSDRLRGKER